MCCIPYAVIYLVCMAIVMVSIVLLVISFQHIHEEDDIDEGEDTDLPPNFNTTSSANVNGNPGNPDNADKNAHFHLTTRQERALAFILAAFGILVGLVLVANIYTIGRVIKSIVFSQRRHLQSAVAKLDLVKSEGYLQVSIMVPRIVVWKR